MAGSISAPCHYTRYRTFLHACFPLFSFFLQGNKKDRKYIFGQCIAAPYYLFYFLISLFLPRCSLMMYHSSVAIQMEEYAPQSRPAINGSANSRILATPSKNSMNTMIKVVSDVLMLRDSVCVKLLLATSARSSGVCYAAVLPRFSRIRSKITIVSLTE